MHNLLHILWDPSPVALDLGFISIAWYGIAWAVSYLIGYYMVAGFFRKEGAPQKWLDSLVLSMVVGGVVGARLGHCLFYEPDYYLSNPLEILNLRGGGMASHGGAIGIILVLWWFSKRISKRSMLWVLDRVVVPVAIAGVLIRVGNFVNQEIVGAPTAASYGVVFPGNDQSSQFRGIPVDEGLEVSYQAGNAQAENLQLLRQVTPHQWESVDQGWRTKIVDKDPWIFQVDPVALDTCCYSYALVGNREFGQGMVPPVDSLDQRQVRLLQNVDPSNVSFRGRWDGDSVRLRFAWAGDPGRENLTLGLFSSTDNRTWTIERSLVLGSGGATIEGAFAPNPGTPTTYRVMLKETADLHYIARHPAQLYEAFAYLLIFLFLFWMYQRQEGRIPMGQLFGLFLALVFSARFLIEFVKENQEGWEEGLPLNMGQMLSIPFVLAGLYFWWTSRQRGPWEEK